MDKAKNDPILGRVFKENNRLFGEDNPDYEQLILCVMLMYESQKGEDSLWYNYMELMPEVIFMCNWDEYSTNATQDDYLI